MPCQRLHNISAVTRIRTWVVSATTRSTNHYTITAITPARSHSEQIHIQLSRAKGPRDSLQHLITVNDSS